LDDVDSVVLYVKGFAECGFSVAGWGVIRNGVGKLRPIHHFPDSTKGWERVVLKPTKFTVLDTSRFPKEFTDMIEGPVRRYPKGAVIVGFHFPAKIGVFRIRVETSPLYIYLKREDEK